MGQDSQVGFGPARSNLMAARPPNPALQTDLAHLAETIAQATSVIQAAGLATGKRWVECRWRCVPCYTQCFSVGSMTPVGIFQAIEIVVFVKFEFMLAVCVVESRYM